MVRRWVLLILVVLALFALNTWAIYALLTSRAEVVVWDFHPRWTGLRAMLRDGADPYGDKVTLSIQMQMLGRPARPDEDQQAFAYPLHVLALIGPLAILPLPVAQAIWFSLIVASLLAFVIVAPRAVGWRPSTWLLALTIFFVLMHYSTVWAVILGQAAIIVAGFIALAWWALRVGRWDLAGACLALATVKPQISFLLVPGVFIWAVCRRRWRLVVAFTVVFCILILLPVPWLPAWPVAWLAAAARYSGYTIFESPLVMVTHSNWLTAGIAVLLAGWVVYCWWRAPERRGPVFDWALGMLLVISALVASRTSHVNHLVLLLPLFFILKRLSKGGVIAAVEIVLLVGLWMLDVAFAPPLGFEHTVWQHRTIAPILPLGLGLALLAHSLRLVRERESS